MKYTVHQAKINLSRLLREACADEEVVILRGKTPVARLVPVYPSAQPRVAGRFVGKLSYWADAFDPLTDRELLDLGFE